MELVLAARKSFFTIFALIRFFSGFIAGINISKVVVEVALEDVILGIEVVVKVAVGLWLWLGAGAATLTVVLIGLPSTGSLSSPIKKGAYIKNGLIISMRLYSSKRSVLTCSIYTPARALASGAYNPPVGP